MSRVAEILMARGQNAANARAASGAFAGQAVATLGQLPGQAIAQKRQADADQLVREQQARRAAADAQQLELGSLQIGAAKTAASEKGALDAIWGSGIFNPDGSVNLEKAEDIATRAGHARLIPAIRSQVNEWNAKDQDFKAKTTAAQKATVELGEVHRDVLGSDGLGLQRNGYDPGSFQLAVAKRAKDGVIPKDEAEALLKRADDPTAVKAIVDGWVNASPKATATTKPITVNAGDTLIDPITKQPVYSAPAKLPNSQESDFMLDGKSVKGSYIPGANGAEGRYFHQGQDVTARAQKIPPASTIINAQNLADAKGDISPTAKAIAEYRMAPPSSRSIASGPGKALMDQVLRHNPDYAADMFSRRAPMAKAFTSGPQSQAINSLNTAIGHLDQFIDVANALDNGSFRPGNEAWNWVKKTFGDSAPTNFEGIRTIMSGELASAFKKSGATDQEIAAVQSALNSANSTKQLIDYATKIAIPALGSKIESYNAQYRQVMGANDPFQVLSGEAEAVLRKHGIDPEHPSMGDKVGGAGAKEGDVKPIDGFPGTEQTFKNGKWIRTK